MTSEHRATPVYVWLVGRHPKIRTLVTAGAGGLLLGVSTVDTNVLAWWVNVIVFALAFDLAAGFVSNLSHSTRSFWYSRSFALRATYVLTHLTLYPLAIWELVPSDLLRGFLAAVLGAKIVTFVIGGRRNSPSVI